MTTPLKIGEGLDEADYPAVKAKVDGILALGRVSPGQLARWCEANGKECACMGCANRHLTWAEFECWKKYGPEFNEIGHPESSDATAPRRG